MTNNNFRSESSQTRIIFRPNNWITSKWKYTEHVEHVKIRALIQYMVLWRILYIYIHCNSLCDRCAMRPKREVSSSRKADFKVKHHMVLWEKRFLVLCRCCRCEFGFGLVYLFVCDYYCCTLAKSVLGKVNIHDNSYLCSRQTYIGSNVIIYIQDNIVRIIKEICSLCAKSTYALYVYNSNVTIIYLSYSL